MEISETPTQESPSTAEAANGDLVSLIEQRIRARTLGTIKFLQVSHQDDELILSGRSPLYYRKQQAAELAKTAISDFGLHDRTRITNNIEVS